MKYLRFSYNNIEKFGIYDGLDIIETENYFENVKIKKKKYNISEIKFLPPSLPTKIIAVGLNYKNHAEELKMPVPENPIIFLKPVSAILAHMENIIYPEISNQLDYEAELAIVIKKKARNISVLDAKDYILGYTCFNDVTARDLQKKDIQWTRSKSFDTFAPFGPFISDEINPLNIEIKLFLNTILKQNDNTSNLIFNVFQILSFVSQIMTLFPGDIIATGTPSGVGSMNRGDEVSVMIQGVGQLINKII